MSNEEKMTIGERRKYLRRMQKRYRRAGRQEKGQLLDEMEQVTELHRKYLIGLLQGDLQRNPRRKQRGRTYGPDVDDVLRVIYESFDYICAERLTPNLVWMAQQLACHGELEVSEGVLQKLGAISISTVGRILGRIRQDTPRLPRKGFHLTCHGCGLSLLTARVAMPETRPEPAQSTRRTGKCVTLQTYPLQN